MVPQELWRVHPHIKKTKTKPQINQKTPLTQMTKFYILPTIVNVFYLILQKIKIQDNLNFILTEIILQTC